MFQVFRLQYTCPYSYRARGCLCGSTLLLERKWLSCMLGKQSSGPGLEWRGMGEERECTRRREGGVCVCVVAPVQPATLVRVLTSSPPPELELLSTAQLSGLSTNITHSYIHRHAVASYNSIINIRRTHSCIHIGNSFLPKHISRSHIIDMHCFVSFVSFVCVWLGPNSNSWNQ